jgi:hypothetical protein
VEVVMKAQFFLLGAILLASLFFVGIPLSGTLVKTSSSDLTYLSGNIADEFARALNFGLAEGAPVYDMLDFVRFLDAATQENYANFTAFWFVTEPQGSGINVYAGNYMETDVNAAFKIGGETNILLISHDSNNTANFAGVPEQFAMNVSYAGHSGEFNLTRDKVNLYVSFWLVRGDSVTRKEVSI